MDETVRYLREFRAIGVETLVFTPHLLAGDLDVRGIEETLAVQQGRFEAVMDHLGSDASVPRLGLGQEVLARTPQDLDGVVNRAGVGLAGGDALLVEFGFFEGFDGDGVIRRVLAEGRRIVVAHPERYHYGEGDALESAKRWHDMGAMLQVNGGSLGGLYSTSATEIAMRLLEEDLVEIIASDHHGDHRPHSPGMISEIVEERMGPERVEAVMAAGPRRALGEILASQ